MSNAMKLNAALPNPILGDEGHAIKRIEQS